MTMNIEFDPSSIDQSKSGLITGIVYFRSNGNSFFPCELWNDFVVVLASWWLDATRRIETGENDVRMQFMDGPYWIDVKLNGKSLSLSCVDDHTPRTFPLNLAYDVVGFKSEIATFATSVWESCRNLQIESEDVRTLGGKLGKY